MQGSVKIDIEVSKADFSQAENAVNKFARDTGKALDPIKRTKLEMNVAEATIKVQALKQQLKDFQGTISQKKQLIIDTNNAQSQLTEAKRKLQNFVNTGDESMSRLQRKFDGIGQGLKNLIPVALIVAAIKKVGGAVLSLTNNLEQNTIAFTSMLGSEEKANKLLKDLSKFASKTPFTIPGIRDNAKQLLAMGVATENLLPTLKMLGDISAGLSVPLERLTLAYGQVLAKGRLQGGELKQFLEAGVPLVATLSKQLGVSTSEFYKMVEAGQISSAQVTQGLESMTQAGGQFNDLMLKQAKSIGGLWSMVVDIIYQLGERIGTSLLPGMKKVVSGIIDIAEKYADAIGSVMAEFFSTIGKMIGEVGKGIASIFNLLTGNTNKAIDEQLTFIDVVLGTFKAITNGLKTIIFAVQSLGKILGTLYGVIIQNTSSTIKSGINGVINGINFIGQKANKIFGTKFKSISLFENVGKGSTLEVMKDVFSEIGDDFKNLEIQSLKTTKSVGDNFLKIGKIDLSKLNSAIKETDSKSKGLDKSTKQLFDNLDKDIDKSESKWKDYQKEIENTKKKITELKDSATEDINNINRELAGLKESGAEDLAKRYAEVVAELAKWDLDFSERNNLTKEKEFLEKNVTEALRNQAIEYSKLNESQKIYADNQKEIQSLKEKQNVNKAFISGNLVETNTGGIGFLDEQNKIIEITDLKNQQYALDLINKQKILESELKINEENAIKELNIYIDLNQKKLELEKKYTKDFGKEIEQQKILIDGLIAKFAELSYSQSRSGIAVPKTPTNTNTQNNTFNISNNVDVKKVTNALTSKIR